MPFTAAEVENLVEDAESKIESCSSLQVLTELRSQLMGKKSELSSFLRELGSLPKEQRESSGQLLNAAKKTLEEAVSVRRDALQELSRSQSLQRHRTDVTLPGVKYPSGSLHPVTLVERDMVNFFQSLGYSIEDGPEVDTDYNNFGALNFPDDHPARDTQDTFFISGDQVLRTHTSNVQVRAMRGKTPPFRFVAPGRVYRHDLDPTHYPMFHQIEAFCVGSNVTFADLKGTLYAFARHLFGRDVKLRFRAHFFPFTEPSAEMDFWWQDRWLEWGGCGMIHPTVLRNCEIDPQKYQGFAFGMGIDRTAMLKFGIPNIHRLFEGDIRILGQLK